MSKWQVRQLNDEDALKFWAYKRYRCEECGWEWSYGQTNFCPNCGAKKEINKEDEDA